VRVVAVDDPVVPRGEVLVKVDAAGMCGSDRHIVGGTYPSTPPVTLGHEFEGTVVATGEETSLAVGEHVTVDPNISCGRCASCRSGLVAHCESLSALGVQRDGGLAELVVVPERQAYLLPDGVPLGVGALCEPLACCLRGLDHATIRPGDAVAVFGGGVMGQLLVQLARLAGATRVVLVTRQSERREMACSLGATHAVDPEAGDVVSAIAGTSGIAPGGVDVAFEAAGVPETFLAALEVTRRRGRVVVVGAAPQETKVEVRPFDLFARELQVQGSFLNPFTHGRAVTLVGDGALTLAPLITSRVSLEEVPEILSRAPRRGEIKTLAMPSWTSTRS
jgi:threonine dehydrogenase-like Zn-dependent dehydrogenase